MTTIVALVSVITSATVAVCVPLLSGRLDRSKLTEQLRAARLDELRSVADAASVALARAERGLRAAEAAVERACRKSAGVDDHAAAAATQADAQANLHAVHEALHRMAVRLGWESTVVQLYARAHEQLRVELKTIDDVREGGPIADTAGWAEVTHALFELRSRYEHDRRRFYTAAAKMMGPQT